MAVVRRPLDVGSPATEVTSPDSSARTRVHEYGGGAWWLGPGGTLFYSNWDDQRVYRVDVGGSPPRAVTPEPPGPGALRYADGRVTPDGRWVVCVRESHVEADREAANEIVAFPAGGEPGGGDVGEAGGYAGDAPGQPDTLVTGPDFVSFPRISADGRFLAWTQWHHPQMPWDGTELWAAELREESGRLTLGAQVRLAGGREESVFQPAWDENGVLHYVSDVTGWWRLYRRPHPGLVDGEAEDLTSAGLDVGTPQWVFGMSRYAFLADGRIVFAYTTDGFDHLGVVTPGESWEPLESPFTAISSVAATGSVVVFVGGSPTLEQGVVAIDLDVQDAEAVTDVRPPRELGVDVSWFSVPEPIDFPSSGGRTAHALFYPPTSPDHEGPEGETPLLLVMSHGGPTSAARTMLAPSLQFWTSRGFAVVDVNYGGSSGYGRAYRRQLDGAWGLVDVDDCVAAAKHLAEQGRVDGGRLAIRGGSAGGFTTLCALTFRDDFAAGASAYGVADLAALTEDTHKFESRYLDGLVGPWPETVDRYRERSPIHHTDRLSCPIILLQGLEDEIVPASQAEMMVDALRSKGLPFAYLAFEGEQHGFRRAENIKRALDAELYFYSRVFEFELADPVDPVDIEGL